MTLDYPAWSSAVRQFQPLFCPSDVFCVPITDLRPHYRARGARVGSESYSLEELNVTEVPEPPVHQDDSASSLGAVHRLGHRQLRASVSEVVRRRR
jgi:hypothetical protein